MDCRAGGVGLATASRGAAAAACVPSPGPGRWRSSGARRAAGWPRQCRPRDTPQPGTVEAEAHRHRANGGWMTVADRRAAGRRGRTIELHASVTCSMERASGGCVGTSRYAGTGAQVGAGDGGRSDRVWRSRSSTRRDEQGSRIVARDPRRRGARRRRPSPRGQRIALVNAEGAPTKFSRQHSCRQPECRAAEVRFFRPPRGSALAPQVITVTATAHTFNVNGVTGLTPARSRRSSSRRPGHCVEAR